MKYIEEMILKYGEVRPGNVLKVDGFLNHRLDPEVYAAIAEEFHRLFKDDKVSLILTAEASGIGIAAVTAQRFKIPALFAKKAKTKNLDSSLYTAKVKSFTHGGEYTMCVSQKYITASDRVLIVDDFLAEGQAALGLKSITEQAGAVLCGMGIVIEKGFSAGGRLLRDSGVRVESLAVISSMSEARVEFSAPRESS